MPRHEQQFTLLFGVDQGPGIVDGAGIRIDVLRQDLWVLEQEGYITGSWNMDPEVPVPRGSALAHSRTEARMIDG